MAELIVKVYGSGGKEVHTINTGDYTSECVKPYDQWLREELALAVNVGGVKARAFLGETCVAEGSLTAMRDEWLLPNPSVSFGYSPTGEQAWNGGFFPVLREAEDGTCIWHFNVPTQSKCETLKAVRKDSRAFPAFKSWWVPHFRKMYGEKAEVGYVIGQSLTMRFSKEGREWLQLFSDAGVEVRQGNKLPKRLKVAKVFTFSRNFKREEIVLKLVEDLGIPIAHKCLVDGLCLVDARLLHSVIHDDEAELYMGAAWGKLQEEYPDGVPENMKSETMLVAKRMQEDARNRATSRRMGSLRVINPEGSFIKGNYLAVEGLFARWGCHILASRENCKKELHGGTEWVIAIDPQKSHPAGIRTSTQMIINNPGIFPEDQLMAWMRNEVIRLASKLPVEIPDDWQSSLDMEEVETEDLSEEVKSVFYRFRQASENLQLAGLTLNHAPQLLLQTAEALLARIVDIQRVRFSLPVPYSMGMQVLSRTMATLAGVGVPELEEGDIWIHPQKIYAVISDKVFEKFSINTGGSDLDDHYNLILRKDKATGEAVVVVLRSPNGRGEWMRFRPVGDCAALFRVAKNLSMTTSAYGAVLHVTEEDMPIPEVDFSLQPPDTYTRLQTGKLKEPTGPLADMFASVKEYPQGYTKEAFFGDIEEAMEGHGPGIFINILTVASMVDMPSAFNISQEKVIDLMQQGGSLEAKARLAHYGDQIAKKIAKYLMDTPEAPRIDRVWNEHKRFVVVGATGALKNFLDAGGHLGEGTVSRLYAHWESLVGKLKKVLTQWLLHWQQEAPEWAEVVVANPDESRRWASRNFLWYKENGYQEWRALCEMGRREDATYREKEEARDIFSEALRNMVKRWGMCCLFARCIPEKATGLINDSFLWNGTTADLVVAYFQGRVTDTGEPCPLNEELASARKPHPLYVLAYRLVNGDVEGTKTWLGRASLRGEFRFAWAYRLLSSHASGGHALLTAMQKELSRVLTPEKLAWLLGLVEGKRAVAAAICDINPDEGGSDTPPTPPAPLPEAPMQEEEEDKFNRKLAEEYLTRVAEDLYEELHVMLFEEEGEEMLEDSYAFCKRFWLDEVDVTKEFSWVWEEVLVAAEEDSVGKEFLAGLPGIIQEVERVICSIQEKADDPKKEAIRLANERF